MLRIVEDSVKLGERLPDIEALDWLTRRVDQAGPLAARRAIGLLTDAEIPF